MNLLHIIPGQYKKSGGKNGGEYAGACPWCGDGGKGAGSDRFRIWPDQGRGGTYWCRRCNKGGDAIKYLMDHDSLSFRDACSRLNLDPAAILPTGSKVPTGWQPRESVSPAETWADHARKFVDWCHDRLLERPIEREWLAARGIDPELVDKYRLGWNPTQAWREGAAWGVTMAKKADGKLKKLWLPRGLVIPMIEDDGRVHRLRIRQPDQSPRYLVIPGSGREPLLSRPADVIFVVESELDAILLDGVAGDLIGVVAMGNDSAKPTARLFPILQQAMFIGVALDSDEPRFNPDQNRMDMPGARSSRWWLDQFPQAVRVPMIGGKDPGDAFKEGVDLRTWVLAALPPYFHVKAEIDAEKARRRAVALDIGFPPRNVPPAPVVTPAELEQMRSDLDAAGRIEAEAIGETKASEYETKELNHETKIAAAPDPDQGERNPGVDERPTDTPGEQGLQTTATMITLKTGQQFYVTADQAEWTRLAAAGKVVFSQNELARLQRACATMTDEERLAAALQALEIKNVFPTGWIRRGEATA